MRGASTDCSVPAPCRRCGFRPERCGITGICLEPGWCWYATLTGYTDHLRVEIDVALGTRQQLAAFLEAGQGLTLTGTCRLQACDDRVCWPPEAVPIEWRFDLIRPDLVKSPESLQHKARS